jgi:hypothetical protein
VARTVEGREPDDPIAVEPVARAVGRCIDPGSVPDESNGREASIVRPGGTSVEPLWRSSVPPEPSGCSTRYVGPCEPQLALLRLALRRLLEVVAAIEREKIRELAA